MTKQYLYYDEHTGEIKALTPIKHEEFGHWACTRIPLEIATKFISAEWDTTKWFVASDSTEEEGILRETQFDFVTTVSDDLIAVPRAENTLHISSAITITVYTAIKTVEVSVAKVDAKINVKDLPEQDMTFFITKRNDPSEVYGEITVPLAELFELGALSFPYEFTANDVSVYTRKLFRFYQLHVKRNKLAKRVLHPYLKVNTLVTYKEITQPSQAEGGLLVTHDVNKGVLVVSMDGDVQDIVTELHNNIAPLYLTRRRDPTVLVDVLYFDLSELANGNKVILELPEHAGNEFGVSGYPYIDNLFFLRT